MNKRIKIISPLLLLALGIALLGAYGGSPVRSQSNPNAAASARIASFNNKAKAAKSGDSAAVGQLADEVFQQFGLPEFAGAFSTIKDRLVRAETSYRQTGKGGIPEPNITRAINGFAKQLNAPDYVVVSTAQVRYLRVKLMVVFPDFISQAIGKQPNKVAINPEMSPLEAAGITLLLIYQKLSNADFQVTPKEWITNLQQQSLEKWRAYKSGNPQRAESGTKFVIATESAKTKELKHLITNAAKALGSDFLLTLANGSLDTLGIPRLEEEKQ